MASQFNNFYPIDNYSQDFNLLENFESTTTDKSVAVLAEKITKKLPSISKRNAEKQAKTILDVTRPLAKKALATKQVLTKKDVNDVAVVAVAQHVLKASPKISVSEANQKAVNIVKPTRKATSKSTSRPTRKATSRPTSKSTSKSTSRPTRKATSRPTRKATSKSTSRPTRKATSRPTLNPATYKPTIRAIAKQLIKTVPGVTPKQAVKQAIKTLKATSKPTKKVTKVRKPNSSHNDAYYKANPNRWEQDILDVSKWLQEKHPNKSPTSYRNYAIYQLRTSRHSLGYLKGNMSARAAWAAYLQSLKNKKTSRPGSKKATTRPGSKKPTTKPVASKIKAAVRSVLVSGNKTNTVLVTAPTKAAAQKKASKVAMESNKFVVKK